MSRNVFDALSPDGNILKKAGMGYLGSVEIPDEALCSLATLLPYIDEAKDRGWQEAIISLLLILLY